MATDAPSKRKIGIALGSGSARGWAHLGVLRELEEIGISPDIVCGTSIGAVVGAFYVSGQLETLEDWALKLSRWDVVQFLDISLIQRGGLIEGERLSKFLLSHLQDQKIDDLRRPFAAVATSLNTGQEIWFRSGALFDAVRASISLPGILTPFAYRDDWLVDGGLVNPVPVSVCRALGAEIVIAVNLNNELVGKYLAKRKKAAEDDQEAEKGMLDRFSDELMRRAAALIGQDIDSKSKQGTPPSLIDVLGGFINIMQDRITRSRMAGDPPEIYLSPRIGHIGMFEFDEAESTIAAGRECVQEARSQLQRFIEIKSDEQPT